MKKIKANMGRKGIQITEEISVTNGLRNGIDFCVERCNFAIVKYGSFQTVFILILSTFLWSSIAAQSADPSILVRGRVFDINDSNAAPAPLILNKRTEVGQSFSSGGQFAISGIKTDTFLITAGGYEVKRICFKDSVVKEVYSIAVGLIMKQNLMKPVAIFPIKDLNTIEKERQSLGVVETRSAVGVTQAVESPITFLYERYSRYGKSKQAVAIMENQDRMNAVYKDLFRTYIAAGVIELDESEFDQFINYLNLPESYLKSASDYDLACTIRQKYLQYVAAKKIHNRNQR